MTKPLLKAALLASTTVCGAAWADVDTAEMIAARQHVFGAEHVDPETGALPDDKVIFSWLSASSFAGAIQGRVIMMDSFLTRLEVERGRTPLVINDLKNLNPEAILLGHGHNDHADNAVYIAAHTDAVIYATEETCSTMDLDFARMIDDPRIQERPEYAFPENAKVDCVPVTSMGSVPGTEVLNLPFLEPQALCHRFPPPALQRRRSRPGLPPDAGQDHRRRT